MKAIGVFVLKLTMLLAISMSIFIQMACQTQGQTVLLVPYQGQEDLDDFALEFGPIENWLFEDIWGSPFSVNKRDERKLNFRNIFRTGGLKVRKPNGGEHSLRVLGRKKRSGPNLVEKKAMLRMLGKRDSQRMSRKRTQLRFLGKRHPLRIMGKRYPLRIMGKRYPLRIMGKRLLSENDHAAAWKAAIENFKLTKPKNGLTEKLKKAENEMSPIKKGWNPMMGL